MENKEALEDAMNKEGYHESDYDKIWREGVQFGVKWQAEQDKNKYSLDDLKHLEFIYGRLVDVHNENPNYDYILKFKSIIEKFKKK
jgi:hypothetical protein